MRTTIIDDREELAWAAGFYDGEGCSRFNPKSNGQYGRVVLQLAQGRYEPLERFLKIVGGYIYGPYRYGTNQQDYYLWSVGGFEQSQAILAALWGFLSAPKREQARDALVLFANYKATHPGRWEVSK